MFSLPSNGILLLLVLALVAPGLGPETGPLFDKVLGRLLWTDSIQWRFDADEIQFFQKAGQSSLFSHALKLFNDLQGEREWDDEVCLLYIAYSV